MTESTPSQAEGDRDQDDTPDQTEEAARTTPSQAEGDRADGDDDPSEAQREWESGWSGP